jgi:hypothetical protein
MWPVQALIQRPDALPGSRGWHLIKNFGAPVTLRVSDELIAIDYAGRLGRFLTPGLQVSPRSSTMVQARAGIFRHLPDSPLRIVITGPTRRGLLHLAVLAQGPDAGQRMPEIWRSLELVGVVAESDGPPG